MSIKKNVVIILNLNNVSMIEYFYIWKLSVQYISYEDSGFKRNTQKIKSVSKFFKEYAKVFPQFQKSLLTIAIFLSYFCIHLGLPRLSVNP